MQLVSQHLCAEPSTSPTLMQQPVTSGTFAVIRCRSISEERSWSVSTESSVHTKRYDKIVRARLTSRGSAFSSEMRSYSLGGEKRDTCPQLRVIKSSRILFILCTI